MADTHALTWVQEDRPQDFNRYVDSKNGAVDLSHGQFRGYDLRKFNLSHANLASAYFRSADLRGLDLSQANLHGASIKHARISGTLFPASLSAEEIRLSLEHGTRLRQPGLAK